MKRTPFKKKPYQWKKKFKKEGKGLFKDLKKEKKGLFRHLKRESKTEEWNRIKRDILNPYVESIGLKDVCEIRIIGTCVGNALPLTYAHSKKRNDIAKNEPERTRELCEVVRACPACHHEIEYLEPTETESGHEQMYRIVTTIIKKRNAKLDRWIKVS